MTKRPIIIGTRGSKLALWQANHVQALLSTPAELEIIKTAGDKFLDIPLQGQLEKGFFTKEIEDLLMDGSVDLAVHSLKDLPTEFPKGLIVGAYLERANPGDVLLINEDMHDPNEKIPLKAGCKVGATSLRRQALLRLFAPQAEPVMLRGNVPTRVRKLEENQYGAIILARAGLDRLGFDLTKYIAYDLEPTVWLPAPGQGVVAIEIRDGDDSTQAAISELHHEDSGLAVELERRLLSNFEGGCHTAFGAFARKVDDRWIVNVGLEGNNTWLATQVKGSPEELSMIGPVDLSAFSEPDAANLGTLCTRIR